jgi:mono/diheme cytochrome c family protein
MGIYRMVAIVVGCVMLAAASSALALKPNDNDVTRAKGKQIYERSCIFCHGSEGHGDGPAGWFIGRYEAPHPRNFAVESFKFRSTPTGELPTDQDLFRTVTQGIPGYMPSFSGLTEEQRWQVIAYVKSFKPAFKGAKPAAMTLPNPPGPPSEAGIENGRTLYFKYACDHCHGENGSGDGKEALDGNLKDARGLTISPGDLTQRTSFKNGASAQSIYRSIMTGLDGTPMPSYADTIGGNGAEVWDLVYYILSLSYDK